MGDHLKVLVSNGRVATVAAVATVFEMIRPCRTTTS
jgi:hypothetical protein